MPRPNVQPLGYCDFSGDAPAPYGYIPFADGESVDDIASARELGYVVKLLAIAEEIDGEIAVRVHPAMVPVTHPLASVRDSFNALFIAGEITDRLYTPVEEMPR